MSRIITPALLKAFNLYKNDQGLDSDFSLCTKLKINRATYSAWKTGKVRAIKQDVWESINNELLPYIDQARGLLLNSTEQNDFMKKDFLNIYERAKMFENSEVVIESMIESCKTILELAEKVEGNYSGN